MGYAQYNVEDHAAIVGARTEVRAEEIFHHSLHPLMDPRQVTLRESRDSEAHPHSLPVAFVLDETGSMHDIPEALAKKELPHFMKALMDAGVSDPQVLFMAVGDATTGYESSPLQVGQFESSASEMDQWLVWSHLEGKGGGNGGESYDLAAYFLARHTETDHYVRRGQRGYAFFTGDDKPFPFVSANLVKTWMSSSIHQDIPIDDMFKELGQRYHTFFLIPHHHVEASVVKSWRRLLGDRVVELQADGITSYVAAGAVVLTEGLVPDLVSYAKTLEQNGVDRELLGPIVRSLTPYANSIGKSGTQGPDLREVPLR